jgi:uncharacterized membrane protein
LRLPAGSSVNSTIMAMSLYRFNGTVSLSAAFPTGWAASSPVPSSLSLTSNFFGCFNSSKLLVVVPSDAAVGKYNITVTGTSGTLIHSANVTIEVVQPDFSVYAFPPYMRVPAGTSMNSTIIVTSLYKFNGTISLSATFPDGWTSSSPATSPLTVTSDHYSCYNSSKLLVIVPSDAAVGKYKITVTGTSGSLIHSANVTLEVVQPDFSMGAFPSYLRLPAGSSVNSTIMAMSLYRFNGTVSLSAAFPTGWAASSPVPSTLSLTSDRNGCYNSSKLSVVVPSNAAVGKYKITVTGTSGSLIHSANVTVEVVQPSSGFGWLRYK